METWQSVEYIVGQRWVSHADSQLGLGIITKHVGRRVTLSFPAVGEKRTYATDNAPLTRLSFKEGDHITTLDDVDLLVTSVTESKGLLFYTGLDHQAKKQTISELELDCFVQLTTPQQRLLNGHFDKNTVFDLRVATFQHCDRLQQSPVRGLMGARIDLLAHQIYIASEVGRRHAPRVLLADEVGLGKTIEAGMIIHQQLLCGRASRILLIVPDSLMHQWLVEMLRRFNLRFALFDHERVEAIEADNPFEAEQLVLCSLKLFNNRKDLQELAINSNWDITVVDEAHHLRWREEQTSEDYQFIDSLAKTSAGLLLLTATPEQIGQASHFARLRLLDPSRFYDLKRFQQEEQGYQQLNELLQQIEAGDPDPAQITAQLPDCQSDDPDQLVAQILDRHGTGRVLFRNTRAAVQGFPLRKLFPYPLPGPQQYQSQSVDEIDKLVYPERRFDDDSWLEFDPRVAWLVKQLKAWRPQKILIICASANTALTLEHYLHLRAGIRSAAFYEGLSIIERDRAAAYFAEEDSGAQTLVCSEIGSEGRNFQFAHHLVLFDLPMNPDLLEQRIGRLDRIGQKHDVHIHVPYLQDSAQETLFEWYDQGLDAFTASCSAAYAIFEKFSVKLEQQLRQKDKKFSSLITDTATFSDQTRAELRSGRDRLLERNSCKADIAQSLIEEIEANEQSNRLQDYMEKIFDAYGVDHEFHSENTLILRPTDHMRTGHFPCLPENGITVCFDRNKALCREDMEFLTWEHPMVVETMEMLRNTELGNSAIATILLRGIPPGTLLLECIYTVNCVAPHALQVERFLPLSPIRLLVGPNGKDLAAIVPHERLSELAQKTKKSAGLAIIKQVSKEVESKIKDATTLAEKQLTGILDKAEATMHSQLGAELSRLQALQKVNPSIRQQEIDHLKYCKEESAVHIGHASLELQALRLIITR